MPVARLDHVTLSTDRFDATLAFYDAALGALGLERVGELVDEEEDDAPVEAAGWGPPDRSAIVWLVTGAPRTTGVHLRLLAPTRADVEAFHGAALAAGGQEHAAPRRWTPYRRGEFAATVRDPAGNLVEVVAPE